MPIAKGGMRPQISATSTLSGTAVRRRFDGNDGTTTNTDTDSLSIDFGVQISQTLFDGFQTRNNVKAAKSNVFASQLNLENTEQNTLFNAGTAYMDVLRDRRLVTLRTRNLEFLREQVRSAKARFDVGEATRTDVSQADASLSQAQALLYLARSNLGVSEATYRQIIGRMPGDLTPAAPFTRRLPGSLNTAIAIALNNHPAIQANRHLVDSASFSVKSRQGAFLPQVGASASLTQEFAGIGVDGTPSQFRRSRYADRHDRRAGDGTDLPGRDRFRPDSPGQGTAEPGADQCRRRDRSGARQCDRRLEPVCRGARGDHCRSDLTLAQNLALSGVIEERNVGQRTTLDVLNAQSALITAQVTQVGAEHDAVVASLGILSATGQLTAEALGLAVDNYDPDEHYVAVKDAWYGLRTPDGR